MSYKRRKKVMPSHHDVPKKKGMSFKESLEILGIPEFESRIFHSHSHGELFHLADYIFLAEKVNEGKLTQEDFRMFFLNLVDFAEKNWQRPESIFQHVIKALLS